MVEKSHTDIVAEHAKLLDAFANVLMNAGAKGLAKSLQVQSSSIGPHKTQVTLSILYVLGENTGGD